MQAETNREIDTHFQENSTSVNKIERQTPQPPVAHLLKLYCLGTIQSGKECPFGQLESALLTVPSQSLLTSSLSSLPVWAEQRGASLDIKLSSSNQILAYYQHCFSHKCNAQYHTSYHKESQLCILNPDRPSTNIKAKKKRKREKKSSTDKNCLALETPTYHFQINSTLFFQFCQLSHKKKMVSESLL